MHGRSLRRLLSGAALALCAVPLASACDAHEPPALRPPAPSASPPQGLRFDTELGVVRCRLFPARTPRAVALVAGLASGTAAFRDAKSGSVRRARYYDGLTFFRRIAGVLVQTGCRVGDGSGHPGYRIAAELHPDDAELLREPGALVMAAYRAPPDRPDPNPPPPGQVIGSQLVITLRPMPHLAGELPVVGRCRDLDVVRALSLAREPPRLKRLEVTQAASPP